MYIGIFERKDGTHYWIDCMDEYEIAEAKYLTDDDNCAGFHASVKSALYDDMTGYVDELQNEESLPDGELYVVCYNWTDCPSCMYQEVDFGITKAEIIENVKNQKYVEGANYFTIGQMFYTTKMYMEGK